MLSLTICANGEIDNVDVSSHMASRLFLDNVCTDYHESRVADINGKIASMSFIMGNAGSSMSDSE